MTGSIPICPLFLRALSIYGITKQARKCLSPILIVFKNQTSHYKIYPFNHVMGDFHLFKIYIPVAKGVPISGFMFFCFFSKTTFSFLHPKRAHDL